MFSIIIIQYFLIFVAMLAGTLSGIYLGFIFVLDSPQNRTNIVQYENCKNECDEQDTGAIASCDHINLNSSQENSNSIRAKMKKQDSHYCFLSQQEPKEDIINNVR